MGSCSSGAKGNRGRKRAGTTSNGFNGKEHGVKVIFDDGTKLLFRIKGTQMYIDSYGDNISPFGFANHNTYDVPINQSEILIKNAKNNGAKATLLTPTQLKNFDDANKKARANDKSDPSLGLMSNGMVAKKDRPIIIRTRRGRSVNG